MELDFRKEPCILGDIVDAMAIAVFTVDAEGNFVAWSDGAARITGYTREEVVGRPCRLLEGENCKGFATLADLLHSPDQSADGICNQECKIMAKSGHELYIHGNVRLLRDDQSKIVGAVGTFTDMTSFVLANEKIALLERQAHAVHGLEHLVGRSQQMQDVFRRLLLAADSDVTVLITGESGTGKELAASAIHSRSARRDAPFLGVNCSAIPESLLESELFGHVKGAFTGAVRDKMGLFQAAEGGTLLLDEIGDVSPAVQVKLLRVLQQREIRRVGDERAIPIDVRLITATNKDLRVLMASNEIREDFFYRIRVFEIHLPTLRERKDDIPLLAEHFINSLSGARDKSIDGITREALQRMMDYSWPGNVRELRNAIEHAFVTVSSDRITGSDLPVEIRDGGGSARVSADGGQRSVEELAEREQIIAALQQTNWSRTEASKLLGFSRVTLWKKMKRYDIQTPS